MFLYDLSIEIQSTYMVMQNLEKYQNDYFLFTYALKYNVPIN